MKTKTYIRRFITTSKPISWSFTWKENTVLQHDVVVKDQYLAFMFEKLLREAGYEPAKGGKDA